MGIPESQLQTWSHQGAIATAQATHESIRYALAGGNLPIQNKDFEIYLQGSYKNDTNIRGDSDVDVVVQLNSACLTNLTEEQKTRLGFEPVSYGWQEIRADILQALRNYYGLDNVQQGKKALKTKTPYLNADVMVCIQYRKYRPNYSDPIKGMTFYITSESRWVINYPKLHYENGVEKNSGNRTNGWYKPTVRLFKNAREFLADRYLISEDLAPSYFLECLIYNVPDYKFGGNYQQTFCNVVNWLEQADFTNFACQNGQLALFGNSPEQWSVNSAKLFVKALIYRWNNW